MSASTAERSFEAPPAWPAPSWWASLAAVLGAGIVFNWAVAAGLLAWLLAHRYRPFDFVISFLVVVAGATFVKAAGGGLTYQLSLLTVAVLVMLACYALSTGLRAFRIPWTMMTVPLFLFTGLSVFNIVRGLLIGNSPKYVFLGAFPLLAIGATLLVASAFRARRDLRIAIVALVLIGFAIGGRGFLVFYFVRVHDVNEYSAAAPGIIAVLLINLALRARSLPGVLGWTLLSTPLFVHQFLTFGRGLWTGCIGAIGVSFLIYLFPFRGFLARVTRLVTVLAFIVGLGLLGVAGAAALFNENTLLEQAAIRLTSITGTKLGIETRSNIIRLWEYATALEHIRQSPWIGHAVGYTFPVEEPLSRRTYEQAIVHQNYLLTWLNQGAVGLVLFLWLLGAAVLLGIREARRTADSWTSSWFATSAAATCFLATLSLSNFPFAVVNETFLLALLWGASMTMAARDTTVIRWTERA